MGIPPYIIELILDHRPKNSQASRQFITVIPISVSNPKPSKYGRKKLSANSEAICSQLNKRNWRWTKVKLYSFHNYTNSPF